MAKYTMTLCDMLKITPLFDFDYTFVSTMITKQELENMITNHYYLHEIGQETIQRFKHVFKAMFLENMIEFQQKLSKYDSFISTDQSDNQRKYHETKTLDESQAVLSPPMTQAASIDKYASEREKKNNTLTTDGYETIPSSEYYREARKLIEPIVLEFIYSLRDCFMIIF